MLLIVVGLLFAACGLKANEVESEPGDGYRGMTMLTPRPKPAFTLTDTSGSAFDFQKETEGYVTLLYFGYTFCPDICPIHMAYLSGALRKLPQDVTSRVKVVFVTVDPDRDTPERLRLWLDAFDPTFIGLTGDKPTIYDAGRRALGPMWGPITRQDLPEGGYVLNHAAVAIAYTTDDLAHVLYPFGVKQEAWLHDLPKLVKEEWKE